MTHTYLLSIDPGVTTGTAYFINGELHRAFAIPFEKLMTEPPQAFFNEVILEFPKWRPHSGAEIDDLLGLAHKAGRIEQFCLERGMVVDRVWPHVWKGSVPKPIHNQRVLRTLSSDELARVPLRPRAKTPDHNCIDAIGIGLWKLGRLR